MSNVEKRLKALEDRVALLEAGANTYDGHKQERAREWLVSYLSKQKERFDPHLPAHSDFPWRIFNLAASAGISKALLRRARRDASVEVAHLKNSRHWIWIYEPVKAETKKSPANKKKQEASALGLPPLKIEGRPFHGDPSHPVHEDNERYLERRISRNDKKNSKT